MLGTYKLAAENFSRALISQRGYKETRTTSVKVNPMFQKEDKPKEKKVEKRGFFETIFGRREKQKPQEPQQEEPLQTGLSDYQNETVYTKNEGVIFVRTGSVIFNNALFLKFNYLTKDNETGERPKISSFIMDEFDEKRLETEEDYRRDFVDKVLVPSKLKNARNVPIFPYIGGFSEIGEFSFDAEVWGEFNKINSIESR